jgi:hypothetical protein
MAPETTFGIHRRSVLKIAKAGSTRLSREPFLPGALAGGNMPSVSKIAEAVLHAFFRRFPGPGGTLRAKFSQTPRPASSLLRFAHKTVKIFTKVNIFTLQTAKSAHLSNIFCINMQKIYKCNRLLVQPKNV